MSRDVVAAYQESLVAYDTARRRVLEFGRILTAAGQQIKADWRLVVAGDHGATHVPAEVNSSQQAVSFSVRDWPSLNQIVEAINAAHAARAAVQAAWARIPDERHVGLMPPPAE